MPPLLSPSTVVPHKSYIVSTMDEAKSQYMRQIYISALQGGIKPQTTKYWKLRQEAEAKLKPEAFAYVDGSASTQSTELNNRKALDNWQIVPRMLADIEISEFKMTREIFGKKFATPIIVSPIGVQGQLHEQADIGTAQAASSLGVIYTHSSAASYSLEEVAKEADFDSGDELGWFQLYWPIDDDVCISILQRAKKAGYKALVVTLDTWILGWRPSDLDTGYNPFLTGKGVANVFSDPVFVEKYCEGKSPLRKDVTEDEVLSASVAAIGQLNPGVSRKWSDLSFLRKYWGDGPIILKGIQSVTDASRAVEAGMDGIWVSNHGGRQVDGALGSLQALTPIASYIKSIQNGPKIIFDSGIRCGADIMKALALGADLVGIGRPWAWGLALNGQEGVEQVLKSLLADLELNCGLAGIKNIDELTPHLLVRAGSDSRL